MRAQHSKGKHNVFIKTRVEKLRGSVTKESKALKYEVRELCTKELFQLET